MSRMNCSLLSSLLLSASLWLGPAVSRRSRHRAFATGAALAITVALLGIAGAVGGHERGNRRHGETRCCFPSLGSYPHHPLAKRTPRHRKKARRKEDLERLRLLAGAVTASEDGVMIAETGNGANPRLRIVFANPAFERMTGYSSDEAVGLSPSVLADDAEPAALEQIRSSLRGTELARVGSARSPEGRQPHVDRVADRPRCGFEGWIDVLGGGPARHHAPTQSRRGRARKRDAFPRPVRAGRRRDPRNRRGAVESSTPIAAPAIASATPQIELIELPCPDLDAGSRFVDLGPGETFTAENWYRRKDGTEFPVEVRFAVLEEGAAVSGSRSSAT